MSNKAVKKLTPEVLHKVRRKLDELIKILEPCLISFPPSEKHASGKTGEELIPFLKMSNELAVEYPDLFPAFIKTASFREEFLTTSELWELLAKINQVRDLVSDAEMMSGEKTLETAMAFYDTVKMAARRDIPGARIIFEELKPAFLSGCRGPGKKKQKKNYRQPELF